MSNRPVVDIDERQIFAMGGGGFTMEPANPLLDDFVLSLADVGEPRILFLPTASGDTTSQINAFKERFAERACVAEHLSLFRLRDSTRSLAEIVLGQDIVYVGGGSMRNLLAIWRAHGLDSLLVAGVAARHRARRAQRRRHVLVPGRRHALQRPARADRRAGRARRLAHRARRRRARAPARVARRRARRHAPRRLGARRRRRAAVPRRAPRARRQLAPRRRRDSAWTRSQAS